MATQMVTDGFGNGQDRQLQRQRRAGYGQQRVIFCDCVVSQLRCRNRPQTLCGGDLRRGDNEWL